MNWWHKIGHGCRRVSKIDLPNPWVSQKDSLRNTPSRAAGYDIIRTILPSCKACACVHEMEASAETIWGVPSLIKSAFIYRGCTIWKLLILGWLDVNEYWGSCWGRCMMKNIRQNIAQPSKNSPCKEACGWGSAAELVLVRRGNTTVHPGLHVLCYVHL